MKQGIFNLIPFFGFLLLVACHKHNETAAYTVNISINKPTAGQVATRNQALPIEVVVTRDNNATIHNLKVEILDASDKLIETLHEKHHHTSGKVTYTEGGYIPKTAGSFKLKATSTSDDKLQSNTKEQNFTVN
jgi:biopolymer transport protein ExbD